MMKRRNIKLLTLGLMTASALAFTACGTVVSEEVCQIGNWEAQGFEDGSKGRSPDRLNKIVEACTEYGLSVDNQDWLKGYEAGLPRYCSYERGYERGEAGSSYNQVCGGDLAREYGPGYEEGRQRYEIYRQYEQLVENYEYKRSRLYELRRQIQEPEISDRRRDNLRRSIRRLEYEIDNLRYNLRQFERRHQLNRRYNDRDEGY